MNLKNASQNAYGLCLFCVVEKITLLCERKTKFICLAFGVRLFTDFCGFFVILMFLSDKLQRQHGSHRDASYELRAVCLTAIQMALETKRPKFVSLALNGMHVSSNYLCFPLFLDKFIWCVAWWIMKNVWKTFKYYHRQKFFCKLIGWVEKHRRKNLMYWKVEEASWIEQSS